MNEPEGCFSIFWLIDILTAKNDFEKLNFEKFKVPREININSKNTIVSFQFAWYLLYWKKNVFPSQILHNPTDNKYYRRCNGLFFTQVSLLIVQSKWSAGNGHKTEDYF